MRDRRMKRTTALLLALCLLLGAFALPAGAEGVSSAPLTVREGAVNGMVRVYLSSLGQPGTVNLTICGSYSLDGSDGTAFAYGSSAAVYFNSSTGHLTLSYNGTSTDMGTDFRLRRHERAGDNGIKIRQSRESSNLYPGDLQFKTVLSGGTYRLYVIAHVFIEDYLYGVLPYEMGNGSALEALKAQCVSARTYTVRAMEASSARSYDLVDTTTDQVYNGTPSGNARCRQAVDETRGIVAMNDSAYTATYYTASNGGQIESVRNIWGSSAYDYIRVKDDPYDYQNRNAVVKSFRVSASGTQSNATLGALLINKAREVFGASSVTVNAVTAVTPHTPRYAAPSRLYTKLDFAVNVTADGAEKSGTLTFDIFSELESRLGMSINNDNNELWTVTRTTAGFTVEARRFGHGTGLSQRGAMRMGELGYTYDRILGFYFEGCRRVQYSFTRSVYSALGTGASQVVLSVDTPAAITQGAASTGIVQMGAAQDEMALRVAASSTADVITGIPHGAAVTVHAAVNDWYLVSYGALNGYVQGDGLAVSGTPDGQAPAVTTLAAYGTVNNTSYLNLREGANMASEALAQIPGGTVLPLLSVNGGWAYTQYGCQAGYVSMDYITRADHYTGAAKDANTTGAVVIAREGAALYLSASMAGYRMLTAPLGAIVKVKYDDGSWSQVYYAGITGYMLSADLQKNGMVVEELADSPRSGEQYALVSSSATTLNMRERASMAATIMLEIPRGETVIVESAGSDWCRVRYHGATGYCATQYLTLGVSGSDLNDGQLTAVVVTESGSLNLRKSDSTQATILTTIPRNATITVLDKGVTWCKVTYGGFIGYSMTKYLSFGGAKPTAAPGPAATPVPAATAIPTAAPAAAPVSAQVTTPSGSLNLRKSASSGAKILARIPQYAVVPVLSVEGTWTRVSYNGETGYVMSTFLTYLYAPVQPTAMPVPAATPAPVTAPADTVYAQVTTEKGSLNLRKRAASTATVMAQIPQNEFIQVVERLGTWTKVVYEGRTGYVMTTFLTFVEVPVAVTPQPTENASGLLLTAQVTTEKGSLNLRERAASSAKVLTTVPQYATVAVLSRGDKWSQVTYGRHTGYVMSSFLTFGAGTAPAATPAPVTGQSEPYARVTTKEGSLNLRKRASSSAAILATIPQYDIVQVLEKGAVWTGVSYGGLTGYVKTEFLTFFTDGSTAAPVVTATPVPVGLAELSIPQAARVTGGDSVILRAEMREDSAMLAIILRGEYVLVTARGTLWCRVDYEGRTGYLAASQLELP